MLQTSKIAAIRAVAGAAPEAALRQLDAALRADGGSGPAALVRDLIDAELAERAARDAVFRPLLALCTPAEHGLGLHLFDRRTPARLWAALKVVASEETQYVLAGGAPETAASVQNRLCLRAAASLRTGEPVFAPVLDGLDPETASRLALALELAPVARTTMAELPSWFDRATGAHIAAMRLAYKDAEHLGEGAGPLLLEMLLAAADEPWRVLQLVGWVMDRPEERYVAESELAGLVLRIIDGVDAAIAASKGADFDEGGEAGLEAARAVEQGLAAVAALESAFTLKRGPWADRVRKQRAALAGLAEARLQEAAALVNALLPAPPLKIAGRTLGGRVRYAAAPTQRDLQKGRALLTFLSETHNAAEGGGFAALWARTAKSVDDRLALAADELVAMLHAGASDPDALQGCLAGAAELTAVVRGPQAAALVRRRAAAA